MATQELTGLYQAKVGSTQIARPTRATFTERATVLASGLEAGEVRYRDKTAIAIEATLDAEDPLSVPTICALAFPQTMTAAGRVVNGSSYRKHTLNRAVLSRFSMTIGAGRSGTVSYSFINRSLAASDSSDDEHPVAAGDAVTIPTRRGIIDIQSATLTPDAGDAVSLLDIDTLTLNAVGRFVRRKSNESIVFEDIVDCQGWDLEGSITLMDQQMIGSLTVAQALAVAKIGSLEVVVRVTGWADEGEPPDDETLIIDRVKFDNNDGNLSAGQIGEAPLTFHCGRFSAGGALLTLANMVSVA